MCLLLVKESSTVKLLFLHIAFQQTKKENTIWQGDLGVGVKKIMLWYLAFTYEM